MGKQGKHIFKFENYEAVGATTDETFSLQGRIQEGVVWGNRIVPPKPTKLTFSLWLCIARKKAFAI